MGLSNEKDGQPGRSDKNSAGLSKFVILVSVILILVVLLVIGCLAAMYVYVQDQDTIRHDQEAARAALPFYSSRDISPELYNSPELFDGPVTIDQQKLIQNDPIVGIWQSTDCALENSDGVFLPVQNNFSNYFLIIYNDHTYLLYDNPNHTYLKGTWEKTVDNPYYNEYSVHESGSNFPVITMSYSHLHIQYLYTYRDDPPHTISSYINYRFLDDYPLRPDTQDYINKRA